MEVLASPYLSNIRYNIAKQQLEDLFLNWIT